MPLSSIILARIVKWAERWGNRVVRRCEQGGQLVWEKKRSLVLLCSHSDWEGCRKQSCAHVLCVPLTLPFTCNGKCETNTISDFLYCRRDITRSYARVLSGAEAAVCKIELLDSDRFVMCNEIKVGENYNVRSPPDLLGRTYLGG